MIAELIGWAAAAILLATLIKQVHTQWHDHSTKGVSRWLFVGQIVSSTGFIVYSWMVQNWVFVTVNVLILITSIAGEIIFLGNQRRGRKRCN
jgi:uncharacterized protein with PQ loop repeat